jgi:hypothetical protein
MSKVSISSATDVFLLDALKSDTVDLVNAVRAIRVAVAGNIKLTTKAGNAVVCAFAAGETRQIYATRIWSTSTTATGMEGHV